MEIQSRAEKIKELLNSDAIRYAIRSEILNKRTNRLNADSIHDIEELLETFQKQMQRDAVHIDCLKHYIDAPYRNSSSSWSCLCDKEVISHSTNLAIAQKLTREAHKLQLRKEAMPVRIEDIIFDEDVRIPESDSDSGSEQEPVQETMQLPTKIARTVTPGDSGFSDAASDISESIFSSDGAASSSAWITDREF